MALQHYVEEWRQESAELEALGWESVTEHLLMLLTAIVTSVDLNALKKQGHSPLHALAEMEKKGKSRSAEERGMNMLPSVKLLEKCGVDVNTRCGDDDVYSGETPLHRAAYMGHFDLVKGLVKAGAVVRSECDDGWTPLAFAAEKDHPLILSHLLKHGSEVQGSEAIHEAAIAGSPVCLKALIRAGAKPNQRNREDDTPAQACCRGSDAKKERAEALSVLLKSGADVHVKTDKDKSLLHIAAACGHSECIPLLLENGLEIDARDANMRTPLHGACLNGKLGCVTALVRRGASLSAASVSGNTALMDAVRKEHVEVVAALLQCQGVSINAKNNNSITALHLGAALGNMEIIYLLVEAGADVNALTSTGEAPLMTCMCPAESKAKEELKASAPTSLEGRTELREKIATFLLKMGAAVDGEMIALAAKKGFGDVMAAFFSREREQHIAVVDRLGTVAEHYSVTADGDEERVCDRVHVRLSNKFSGCRGRKKYSLSIPLVEKLMEKIREGREAEEGGGGGSHSRVPPRSAAGILPTYLDPAKYGYKSGSGGGASSGGGVQGKEGVHGAAPGTNGSDDQRKGKGKGKVKEVELVYDGISFTEEGFEAVVKFVTTGSVEGLLAKRPVLASKRKRSGDDNRWMDFFVSEDEHSSRSSSDGAGASSSGEGHCGGSSSGGSSRAGNKGRRKLFDVSKAKQALQAAEFFCLEGMSREVKALMGEYGFELQSGSSVGGSDEGSCKRSRSNSA